MSSADVKRIPNSQLAIIVVDALFLVLNANGIRVSFSESAMRATLKSTAKAVQNSPKILRAIQAFFTAWKEAGGSKIRRAYALLCFFWDCSVHGILWTIIKSLYEEMSWADWCKTSLQMSTSIYTLFATPGVALSLTTISFAVDLRDFAKKIQQIF